MTDGDTEENEITIHRTIPVPNSNAYIGYSDDHPGKQFLIIPKEQQ